MRPIALVLSIFLAACGSPTTEEDDAGTDGGELCGDDDACDDRLFCNGVERCVPESASADARGCVSSEAEPCAAGQTCDEGSASCQGACTVADADGDGEDAIPCGGLDCDDTDPARSPFLVEVCDAADRDEDCDPSTFGFRDLDADGVGDARCCNGEGASRACGSDCDDARASTRPGQVEICNGIDDDCDAAIDEGALRRFWPDADFDGFGDASATPERGCAPPAAGTFVENPGDCDDGSHLVAPSSIEVCNGIDDDCDAASDEAAADRSCDAPNGVFACVAGRCTRVGCAAPFEDCDGDAATGCESDIRTSALHCGSCGNACGAGGVCEGGSCDRVIAIASGRSHVCALRARGAVVCWGDNALGQLGDGTRGDRLRPTPIASTASYRALALGSAHSCAIAAADEWVDCWGTNELAQLGDGGTVDRARPGPVAVPETELAGMPRLWSSPVANQTAVGGRRYVDAGYDGVGVRAWGDNVHGLLGDGTTTRPLRPVAMSFLRFRTSFEQQTHRVDAIAFGSDHVCVGGSFVPAFEATARDSVVCWGQNGDGQLGNASVTSSATPVFASFTTALSGTVGVAAGARFTCATAAGAVYCWGTNGSGNLGDGSTATRVAAPVRVAGISDATAICAGSSHACAVRGGGVVSCWGGNWAGQIGDGTTTERRTPVAVTGLADATSIACGAQHTCALRASGEVVCWGHNGEGQLGDGTRAQRSSPAPVAF